MASRNRLDSTLTGLLGVGLAVIFITAGTYKFAIEGDASVVKFVAVLAFSAALLMGSAVCFRHGRSAQHRRVAVSTRKEAIAVAAVFFFLFMAALCFAIWGQALSPVLRALMLFGSLYLSYGAIKLILRLKEQGRQAQSGENEIAEQASRPTDRE
jgi:threonine/homoserine/homoserine lactone efflux protein